MKEHLCHILSKWMDIHVALPAHFRHILALPACLEWSATESLPHLEQVYGFLFGPACSFFVNILALPACLDWLQKLCRIGSKWTVFIWPCLLIFLHILALPAHLEWLQDLSRIWNKRMVCHLGLLAHCKLFVAFGASVRHESYCTLVTRSEITVTLEDFLQMPL